MQLLDFKMPPFKLLAWVSDEAKAKWQVLFRRINLTSLMTAIIGVSEGKWEQRHLRVHGWLYLKLIGLSKQYNIEFQAISVGDNNIKGPVFYDVIIFPSGQEAKPLRCCENNHLLSKQQNRKEFLWESALATADARISENMIEIDTPVVMGSFWQQAITNSTAHVLCRLDCPITLNLQKEHLDYMQTLGFDEAAEQLTAIYSWPVEWSSAHGICELRTPVLKISYDTDAIAAAHRIQIQGTNYPAEGLQGLNFPYKRRSFLKITDSKSFKNGLAHGIKDKN